MKYSDQARPNLSSIRDKSGSINRQELEAALTTFGYNLTPPVYALLLRKFDRTKRDTVCFDDFIQCCLCLHVRKYFSYNC